MKIESINEYSIQFNNGSEITFRHYQDCCERNYADFEQIEKSALEVEFNENLIFEELERQGFRFGSVGTLMFFVPCYSKQNGYYSSDIEIYYNKDLVINTKCEEIDE